MKLKEMLLNYSVPKIIRTCIKSLQIWGSGARYSAHYRFMIPCENKKRSFKKNIFLSLCRKATADVRSPACSAFFLFEQYETIVRRHFLPENGVKNISIQPNFYSSLDQSD